MADRRDPRERRGRGLAGVLADGRAALAALALVAVAARGQAADLTLDVGTIAAAAWRADGVTLALAPPHDLSLRIAALTVGGQRVLRNLRVRCPRLLAAEGTRCDDASFAATLPGGSRLEGRLQGSFDHPRRWQARLDTARLHAVLEHDGDALVADITAAGLDYSEPAGRYAAEKLAGTMRLRWDGRRLDLTLDARSGQAYFEPVFLDFAAQPLRVIAALARAGSGWRIERLGTALGRAGTVEVSGQLDARGRPLDLDVRIDARDLGPLLAAGLTPFLVGTPLEGLEASGPATATLALRQRAPRAVTAQLGGVALGAAKLGVSLDGLAGELHWAATPGAASRLRWRGGALKRVPLGPSELAFVAHGNDFALTAPWRQPLLGGALDVPRLALRDIGGAHAAAEFDGVLEPIDLAALCRALGWPEFGGTLGGRLPGLRLRDDAWSLEGALEAQVFDGSVRVGNLGVTGVFGAQPRVTADVELRRLDLDRVTRAFSFGRISGRLDGEVTGLGLLNWRPVAFDARLYSTPGYRGPRRISQRAIDSLSSIGGAPTGALSRGFLGLFDDFAYARLGIGCVLRDGVCEMDGVEPAPAAGGVAGYILVKGRLLPRIDVVGYARRVSWATLIEQLEAAQASEGPELGKP